MNIQNQIWNLKNKIEYIKSIIATENNIEYRIYYEELKNLEKLLKNILLINNE